MSQTLWQQWTTEIAQHISLALGETVEVGEVVVPPDNKLGDFAVACFKYAKGKGTNPAALAKEIVGKLETMKVEGMTFVAAGPYVNILLDANLVLADVVERVGEQGQAFGMHEPTGESPILVEYANPNTHKEIHLGHLRNFLTGRAFVSVLKAAGKKVVPVSFVNDQGANVAKTLWWMLKMVHVPISENIESDVPKILTQTEPTGRALGRLYTEATRAEEADPDAAREISFVQSMLEAHNSGYERLWLETRNWCLTELDELFRQLDIHIEKQYLESACIDRAQEVVDELIKKGIARESQGAYIVDLEEKKLGVMLVRKSDGNLLYASKDLALAEQKVADYPGCTTYYSVVDVRQSLYFKQLAEVLRQLGYTPSFQALTYGLLTLPDGAMSSRKGNIVTFQDLQEDVVQYAQEEVAVRHSDWDANRVKNAALDLALGGITFSVLKQDPDKTLVFDKQQALSFEGATGPYCQYAVTRLNAILRKAMEAEGRRQEAGGEEDTGAIHSAQKALALTMAQLPEKVSLAAKELRPSVVAQWCLEMAQAVSAFYRDVPVLSSTTHKRKERLELVKAAKTALSNGLRLLGIPTPEEM